MSKPKLKYIKYTRKELNKYVSDKSSCINKINNDLHIGFPPYGFANFRETLINIISRDKVGKFDAKSNGIILDVSNIKVFGTSYAVHDDDPNNHININADFYVFQPTVGAIIKGVVKHISQGHVAVIIYRVFNVSIRFKKVLRQPLRINQQISFKIKKFDLHDAMPYIEGELIEQEINTTNASTVNRKIKFDEDEDSGNVNDSGISTEETEAKIKRKRGGTPVPTKKNNNSSSSESSSNSSSSDDSDSDSEKYVPKIKPSQEFDISKVKKEKFTDVESSSESEPRATTSRAALNALKKDIKKPPDSSESSSSSSEDDEPTLTNFKKEEDASSSSSEEDSKPALPIWKKPLVNPRARTVTSSQETNGFPKKTIKSEPMSDVESISSKGRGTKRKRELSISEQLDSLYTDAVGKVEKPDAEIEERLRNTVSSIKIKEEPKAKKRKTGLSQSISDLSIALSSPALSSTLKSGAKSSKSKEKVVIKTEMDQSGSESSSTKEKSEPKKKSKKKGDGLKSAQDELFNSFLH